VLAGEEVMSTRKKIGPSKESSLVKPCRQQPASQKQEVREVVLTARRGSSWEKKGQWSGCRRGPGCWLRLQAVGARAQVVQV
jgi:hypothetical protein